MFDTFKTCERCAGVRESLMALGYCHPAYGDLREDYLEYLAIEREMHPGLPMPRNHLTRGRVE